MGGGAFLAGEVEEHGMKLEGLELLFFDILVSMEQLLPLAMLPSHHWMETSCINLHPMVL